MATPQWSETYATSIRPIDNDHKGLFEAVAQLETDAANGVGEVRISTTISSLILYVREHFEREERFMWKAGYPDFQQHKAEHDRFRDTILALQELYNQDPDSIDLPKVVTFLNQWLIDHIMKVDGAYVPYVKGDKEGVHEAMLGARPGTTKMTEMRLKVSEDKADIIRTVAEALSHDGLMAGRLEAALTVVMAEQADRRLKQARKLFGHG